MASKQPAHSGSAQTKEFDISLVGERIRGRSPNYARAVVSVDANHTLRVEIEAANELNWELDARMATGSLEILRAFNDGDGVPDGVIPNWVERVARIVGERLVGDR